MTLFSKLLNRGVKYKPGIKEPYSVPFTIYVKDAEKSTSSKELLVVVSIVLMKTLPS